VRAGPALRLLSARRLLRDSGEASHLLVHAHLRPRAEHRHARAVLRRLKLLDHLRQLRVRAAGVDDHGAARLTRRRRAIRIAAISRDPVCGGDPGGGGGVRGVARSATRVKGLTDSSRVSSSRDASSLARVRLAPPERRAQQTERLAGTCVLRREEPRKTSFCQRRREDPLRAKMRTFLVFGCRQIAAIGDDGEW